MAQRLEIELTSTRADGMWTWRAAGAKQPRGELDGAIVPEGVKIGDVVKVEVEASLEGLEITAMFAPKPARPEPELLEIMGSGGEEPLVTSRLAPGRERRGRGESRERRGRGESRERRGRGESRERRGRSERQRRDRDDRDQARGRRRSETTDRDRSDGRRDRSSRADKPKSSRRPKPKRLRPARVHRKAALAALPEDQRLLADEVLHGGVPGLRQAIERMNEKASAEGMPKINGEPLVALAEQLAPALKSAEWRDRADAVLAGMAEIDLRDIRSVVVAADTGARDEEGREVAEKLRAGLAARVETEHRKWLGELAQTIGEGRTVRALRLSSRPPKAGTPLPPDMADKLAMAASAGLDSDTGQDRWVTMLDAVAYSPVRAQVTPAGLPAQPGDSLMAAVRKLASRVPQIAQAFGVEAPATRRSRRRRPSPPPPPPPSDTAPPPADTAPPEPPTPTPPAPASAPPPADTAPPEPPTPTPPAPASAPPPADTAPPDPVADSEESNA